MQCSSSRRKARRTSAPLASCLWVPSSPRWCCSAGVPCIAILLSFSSCTITVRPKLRQQTSVSIHNKSILYGGSTAPYSFTKDEAIGVSVAFLCVCTMYACMHVCLYACMRVCLYVCMSMSLYLCLFVCVYVCTCVYLYVYTHAHVRICNICILYTQRLQYPLIKEYTLNHTRHPANACSLILFCKKYWSLCRG